MRPREYRESVDSESASYKHSPINQETGRGAVWLARWFGEPKDGGSNPLALN